MKIAIVAPMDPRTGISNYSETLAIELLKLGQEVDMVAPENSKNIHLTSMDHMKHIKPEAYDVDNYDVTHFQLANSPLHEFQLHIIHDNKEDLIQNDNIITTIHDARNFDVFDFKCSKCILNGFSLLESPLIYPYDIVDKSFQRISNMLLFHSNSAMNEYQTRYKIKNKKLRRVLHPAYRIPGTKTVRPENRSKLKTMVAPGYISPFKGHDIVIRSVADVDMDFKLIFMGKILNEGYGNYLNDLIKEYDIEAKVQFLGFVSNEEFIMNIDNAEAVLVPRLTSPWLLNKSLFKLRSSLGLNSLINQSTSGVITKALASGKPVICSKNQGFADYIDDSRGIMCNDQVESWSKAIKYILENPNKVKEMAFNSRRFADTVLKPSKIAEEHLNFYRENFQKKIQKVKP